MTTKFWRNYWAGGWLFLGFLGWLIVNLGGCNPAKGATCGIIVKDNTSRATVGADTSIGDNILAHFGYAISYLDVDVLAATPTTYNSAFFDTFRIVISVGANVAAPTPTAVNYLDTLNNAYTNWLACCYLNWNEINLGVSSEGTSGRDLGYGYLLNVAHTEFPTSISQDTINAWNSSYRSWYGLVFPDTCHDIRPLILAPDRRTDSARIQVCIADSGATVINTGDGRNITKGRRAFWGLWSAGIPTTAGSAIDSCLLWKPFERLVAWVAEDTTNNAVKLRRCFSGSYEIVLQHSEKQDSLFCEGSYNGAYVGHDYVEQLTLMRLRDLAVLRSFTHEYRAVWANTLSIREYLAVIDHGVTNNWEIAYAYKPIKVPWHVALPYPPNAYGCDYSETCPFATYKYTYKDTSQHPAVDHTWNTFGGQGDGTDRYNEYADSIHVRRVDNSEMQWYACKLPIDRFNSTILDTATALGWMSSVLWMSDNTPAGAGPELKFSNSNNDPYKRPLLTVLFDSVSTTAPPPIIVVSPTSVTVSGAEGGTIASGLISVTNYQGGQMLYSVPQPDSAWLHIEMCMPDGQCWYAPSQFNYSFNYGARPPGSYEDTMRVTCDDASNSPEKIPVHLSITAAETPPTSATTTKRVGVLK